MKRTVFSLFLLLLAFAPRTFCQDVGATPPSENTTAIFNSLYPDLMSHQDVVSAAALSLTAEGFQAQTLSSIMEAVATRARTNLQHSGSSSDSSSERDTTDFKQREKAAREQAEKLFPELTDPASPLYHRVTQELAKLNLIYPNYFKNPDWPLMITRGCIASMTLEGQETRAQQQSQANQSAMSIEQAKQTVELLQMLQKLKDSQSGASRRRQQTSAEKDAYWQQWKLQQMQSQIEQLRQQQSQ